MRRFASRSFHASAVLAIAALVAAGCSDDEPEDSSAPLSEPPPAPTFEATTPAETTAPPADGEVTLTAGGLSAFPEALTDGEGTAVYTFSTDQQGESTCVDQCAVNWPPVLSASGEPPAVEGAAVADQVGVQARADGTMQVTYNGWPLYYFFRDAAPGDASGQGISAFGGQFLLIGADGTVLSG